MTPMTQSPIPGNCTLEALGLSLNEILTSSSSSSYGTISPSPKDATNKSPVMPGGMMENTIVFDGISYAIKQLLGRGSYGRVFKVVSPSGETFVVKQMYDHFDRESAGADLVRGIPGTCQVVASNDATSSLLMTYAGESNLMRYYGGMPFMEHDKQSIAFFLRMFATVVKAVGSLHTRGYIHGDIKPENIVVNSYTGVQTLVDFGLVSREGGRGLYQTTWYRSAFTYATNRGYKQGDIFALLAILRYFLIGFTIREYDDKEQFRCSLSSMTAEELERFAGKLDSYPTNRHLQDCSKLSREYSSTPVCLVEGSFMRGKVMKWQVALGETPGVKRLGELMMGAEMHSFEVSANDLAFVMEKVVEEISVVPSSPSASS